MTDPTERFVALVQGPEEDLHLDEAALLIAAHAHPELDLAAHLGTLDRLAEGCPAPTLEALLHHLFDVEGFRGNTEAYADPRNSYLDDVLERRLGIPISLGVVVIEVGRRLGLPLSGVNMPGHFLVRHDGIVPVVIDPFHRGRLMEWADCEALLRTVHPAVTELDTSMLAPAPARVVLARMLANLKQLFTAADDARSLVWVLRLRSSIPGVPLQDSVELAETLAALGRFDEAAGIYEGMAEASGQAERLEARASRLRARLN